MSKEKEESKARDLDKESALYFRDKLREARYLALADAEGFPQICYAVESLGSYLKGEGHGLGDYYPELKAQIKNSDCLSKVASEFPGLFAEFDALYATLKDARNDAMHSGVYARHAAEAGINLCLMLEEALLVKIERTKVSDFMVRNPVCVESWHPVAFARQLMLTHSFSFLPVKVGQEWKLLSEVAMAAYIFPHSNNKRREYLNKSIIEANSSGEDKFRLALDDTVPLGLNSKITSVFERKERRHSLWVVVDEGRLVGVLSPFELM